VVRFQGPQANGMPELHKLTPPLAVLQGKGFKVALVTDGRMSGAGQGAGRHPRQPEALAGGPLARVRDGDGCAWTPWPARWRCWWSSRADAQAAAQAGARFAVSPGYTSAVGRACRDAGLALLPGVATGSEIMMAQEDGFTELKFFPAMQAGGPAMLKAWSGPFFDIRFCPTGGVTLGNAPDFLALPNVVCVGGSWLVPADTLAQCDWTRITQLARDTQKLQGK
jgi:hypothetical protein